MLERDRVPAPLFIKLAVPEITPVIEVLPVPATVNVWPVPLIGLSTLKVLALLFVQFWLAPSAIDRLPLNVWAPFVAPTLMPPEPSVSVGLPLPANVKADESLLAKVIPEALMPVVSVTVSLPEPPEYPKAAASPFVQIWSPVPLNQKGSLRSQLLEPSV